MLVSNMQVGNQPFDTCIVQRELFYIRKPLHNSVKELHHSHIQDAKASAFPGERSFD